MILASELGVTGDVEGGYIASLFSIQNFPTSVDQFILKTMDEDGTIHLSFNDSLLVLSIGDDWVSEWTSLDTTIRNITDDMSGATRVDTLIVKYTFQERIINWGFMENDSYKGENYFIWF